MKKPLYLIFSDPHLHQNNISSNIDIYNQLIDFGKSKGIETFLGLGDFFESRTAQPLSVLRTFGSEILPLFEKNKISLLAIPGNHDKVDYESEDSYLDEFRYHPNFTLFKSINIIEQNNLFIHLIPFFKESTIYGNYLKQSIDCVKKNKNKKHILCTHIGIEGILDNDRNIIKTGLSKKDFSLFDKVLIGHYHDRSVHNKNIIYIGSTHPQNYGEDNDKGCIILYDDGSIEYNTLNFKKYYTIEFDLDNPKDLSKIDSSLEEYKNSKDNYRFLFFGKQEDLVKINEKKFESVGIKVEKKRTDIVEGINLAKKEEFISFNKESIISNFDKFCKTKQLSKEEILIGKTLLNNHLK